MAEGFLALDGGESLSQPLEFTTESRIKPDYSPKIAVELQDSVNFNLRCGRYKIT
jgi:hypothetical protein